MNVGTKNSTAMNYTEQQDAIGADSTVGRWTAMKSLQYAWDCYNPTSLADSNTCKLYTIPSINATVNTRVPCPFDENICGLPQAISVDTGLVDSNAHLGINTSPSGRLQFRKVLTCVPTTAEERYSTDWEVGPIWGIEWVQLPQDKHKYYYLGPLDQNNNYTFSISNYSLWTAPFGYQIMYGSAICVILLCI
jgi:hypothetical protein